jgi:DNA helicase IV
MTIVGDIAQATGAWPHDSWESVLAHLPDRRPARRAELTVGYRVPGPIMDLAARVLPLAAPGLAPPDSVRHVGDEPVITEVPEHGLGDEIVETVRRELKAVGSGNVAVIAPESLVDLVDRALTDADIEHGRATRQGLDRQITVVPVGLAKGLELDAVVVVEPARILTDEARGAQALYVSLTRSTKRLSIVHSGPLPEVLRG